MGGTIIKKLCNSFSCATQRFQLVQDEKGHTTGFAFVEYQSKIEAERAIQKMHGQSLGQGRPQGAGWTQCARWVGVAFGQSFHENVARKITLNHVWTCEPFFQKIFKSYKIPQKCQTLFAPSDFRTLIKDATRT